MGDIAARLRNFAVWNARYSYYDPVPVCREGADEIERLRRRVIALEMVIGEELSAEGCSCDANRMLVENIRERSSVVTSTNGK